MVGSVVLEESPGGKAGQHYYQVDGLARFLPPDAQIGGHSTVLESFSAALVLAEQFLDGTVQGLEEGLDLVELDVYSLALAAEDVRPLDRDALAPLLAELDPVTVQAGSIDGLRFLPHRVSWQAMLYDHAARRRSYQLLAEAFGLRG